MNRIHPTPAKRIDEVDMGTRHRIVSSVMAAAGFGAGYHRHVRPWMYAWGADPTEVDAELPGDDVVEAHAPRNTRAVTIDAAPDEVWPWLAQIGEGRGGFYSYAWLERIVGADIHNADRVHPEWDGARKPPVPGFSSSALSRVDGPDSWSAAAGAQSASPGSTFRTSSWSRR